MPTDPQGYPLQQYLNLHGDVVFEILSDGTVVLKNGTTIGGSASQGIQITDSFGNVILTSGSGITITPGTNLPISINGKTNLLSMSSAPFGIQFTSLKLESVTSFLLAAGDTTLVTGAAGKKTFVDLRFSNYTGGAITMNSNFVDENSNSFANQLGVSVANNVAGAGTGQTAIMGIFSGIPILEAGQALKVTSVSAPNLTAFLEVWTMDAIEPIRTIHTNSIINGDNVIYTCPVGKKALIYSATGNQPRMGMVNQSGVTVTYLMYLVRNGQVKGQVNQFISSFTLVNNTSNSSSFSPTSVMVLSPGDALVLNASAAGGQNFYVFYLIEF